MNILFLSQYFYPEQFLNNQVARDLVSEGHRVKVISCVPNYPQGKFFKGYTNRKRRDETWNGVEINRARTVARGTSPLQLLVNYLAYPVAASWRIIEQRNKGFRADVSFVSMPSPLLQAFAGIFAKTFYGVPTVYWVQDIWPDSAILTLGIRNRLVIKILNAICGWLYRRADTILIQSDGFRDRIAGYGVSENRIVTLPNTAPPFFRPISMDAIPQSIQSRFPTDRTIIMFAGNIGESQGFDNIIAVAKDLPEKSNILLAILGSGRDEHRVRTLIKSMGVEDRFCFLGRQAEREMPYYFACADAMLVSLKDYPIFALTIPSKVQAYMACSRPIIAALAGEGARVINEAQAGVVSKPGDARSLCRSLLAIEKMPKKSLNAMGANGYAYFQKTLSAGNHS